MSWLLIVFALLLVLVLFLFGSFVLDFVAYWELVDQPIDGHSAV